MEIKVERVNVDKETRHTPVDVGSPPPSVILSGELEIKKSHGDERRDNHQQDKCKEKDTEECVNLVAPHGSENVVKFNVNCRKRQKASNDHLETSASVEWNLRWNLSGHLRCSRRRVELVTGILLGHRPSDNRQGKRNEDKQRQDGHDRSEGQSTCRSVNHCDRIYPHEYAHHGSGEQTSC